MENLCEIEKLMKTEKNAFLLKRMQIVAWNLEGKDVKEIVELSKKSLSQVYVILRVFSDGGIEGLRARYCGGNNRYLSFDKEKSVLTDFAERAQFGEFLRTCGMQEEFQKKTGVIYSVNAFYDLLHRHGWRKLKPRWRHPKRASDEAIEASKKLTLLTWS